MTHNEPTHKLTVKVGDALRTIQGYSLDEYRLARAELIDDLQGDVEAVQLAKAAGAAAPLVVVPATTAAPTPAPIAAPPAATGWDAPAAPAPSFAAATAPMGAAPTCQHGNRVFKEGIAGPNAKNPGRPYKMWVCPSPDRNSQCKPVSA